MAETAAPTREQDQIAKQARAEYEAGLKFRHDREKQWQLIEDFYFNRVKKSLKGKFNVPVPIIPGFVDTWQAKLSKPVPVTFDQGVDSADYRAAKKATAFYQKISVKNDYDHDMLETDGTKIAGLYGVTSYKYYAQSIGGYKSVLELIDPYDDVVDPMGGGVRERHKFYAIDNLFRSREDLKQGAESKVYDAGQVTKIINATQQDTIKDNDTQFRSKQNRLMALNLNGLSYNYAGQDLYKFIEAGTTWKGQRYYVVFNYETGIWIRCQPLKEVFKSDLWPVVSWHTNRDIFNFYSKSPCDDMLPIAEAIRVLVNQELDNRNKRNYGMRAYDPEVFKEPAKLEWRQDGLVALSAGTWRMQGDMNKALFNFETPELNGSIDLANWFDNMLKEKTGVNSESQGSTDSSKVGIAYLNVQQSAERTKLTYQSKTKCWVGIGRRFLWGLHEHMRSPEAVRIIGEKGYEEDKLKRIEVNPEWDVTVSGGDDEKANDAIQKKQLVEVFKTMAPDELAVTSPKWRVKVKLQSIDVPDDELKLAFDLQDESNREVLSRASLMIQDCLAGKPYKPYRGATTAFCQKILDFATEEDLPMDKYNKLMEIVAVHTQIAAENAARKAVKMRAQMGMGPVPMPGEPGPPQPSILDQPAPATPGGAASQSQQLTTMAPAMGQMMQ
jgi:hypothetical protein